MNVSCFLQALELVLDAGKGLLSLRRRACRWYHFSRPSKKLLGSIVDNKVLLRIFVKDFIVRENIKSNPKLFSVEGPTKQVHPNIDKVWAEAEVTGVARLLNLLGQLGKREKLEIVKMSEGYDLWNSNMIVLGGQAMKSMNFYQVMDNVAYSMDEHDIYDNETGETLTRENGYGYGIILKANNPQASPDDNSIGILLGGYGTLGTRAAIYYFCQNVHLLGREFRDRCFGLVVRAKVTAGEQSVRRLESFDKAFSD